MITLKGVTPADRARERLRALLDRHIWTQREFAERVGKSQPWLQKILDGENHLRLEDLDTVATALNVPTAELIRGDQDELVELTPSELRLLRAFRDLTNVIQGASLQLLEAAAHNSKLATEKLLRQLNRSLITASVYPSGHGGESRPVSASEFAALRERAIQLSVDLTAVFGSPTNDRATPSADAEKPSSGKSGI